MLIILLVLSALVARVDAAPGGASIERAMRDADPLAGAGHPAALDPDSDEDGDEEVEDRAAEHAEIDGREDAEDIDDRGPFASNDADPATSLALDGDDAGPATSLALGEDDAAGAAGPGALAMLDAELAPDNDAAAGAAGSGALAMLDAELAPGDATAGLDAADAGATAGAQELYEQWMRHQRPSLWGRLDVGVSWRRRWSAPIHTKAYRHDEIWLVATWRR